MEQFWYDLQKYVKDILLTFLEELELLTKAIIWAVRPNNRLFQQRLER